MRKLFQMLPFPWTFLILLSGWLRQSRDIPTSCGLRAIGSARGDVRRAPIENQMFKTSDCDGLISQRVWCSPWTNENAAWSKHRPKIHRRQNHCYCWKRLCGVHLTEKHKPTQTIRIPLSRSAMFVYSELKLVSRYFNHKRA